MNKNLLGNMRNEHTSDKNVTTVVAYVIMSDYIRVTREKPSLLILIVAAWM